MTGKWQPISTAPKDKESILAYQHFGGGVFRICTMQWDAKDQTWRADIHPFVRFEPTHWQALPDPPAAEEEAA